MAGAVVIASWCAGGILDLDEQEPVGFLDDEVDQTQAFGGAFLAVIQTDGPLGAGEIERQFAFLQRGHARATPWRARAMSRA